MKKLIKNIKKILKLNSDSQKINEIDISKIVISPKSGEVVQKENLKQAIKDKRYVEKLLQSDIDKQNKISLLSHKVFRLEKENKILTQELENVEMTCKSLRKKLKNFEQFNEWYYPSECKYPNCDKDILCYIDFETFEVGYFHKMNKNFYTIDGKEINVKAWKWIVPPLKKE